ncbi:MAG: hypothetical protein KAR11_08355 [Phycisphaerae bacterium]|nr:hypothetical protein [Phycisphaerae bacterium]
MNVEKIIDPTWMFRFYTSRHGCCSERVGVWGSFRKTLRLGAVIGRNSDVVAIRKTGNGRYGCSCDGRW